MPLRYLAVLAAALLIPACATTDATSGASTDASTEHASTYVRGEGLFSELDIDASPRAVAECAARQLQENRAGSIMNPTMRSAIPEIRGADGHVVLLGRAGIGNPYAVDLRSSGNGTRAEVYIDMEWYLQRQSGETVTEVLRECGEGTSA